jgi:DNA-binding CsgD family transcriptional regulator
MPRALRSDEDLLAHAALGLWELEDLRDFRTGVLSWLHRLVPADIASYNEAGPTPEQIFIVTDPPEAFHDHNRDGRLERFAELLPRENPLASHALRTGTSQTMRMSDFISQRGFQALEIYDLIYRPLDTNYQLAFTMPSDAQLIGVTVSRGARDFDDREVDLLDGIRETFVAVYRNLHDRARLDVVLRALDEQLDGPLSILLVEQSGLVHGAHAHGEQQLATIATDHAALTELLAWARLQRREHALTGSRPRSLQLRGLGLQARYLHGHPGALDAIVIHARADTSPQMLRALGLTARQAEVLHLLWQGADNDQIALALCISAHTVRHHLESIYRQLDVNSRVAAAHIATQTLSG